MPICLLILSWILIMANKIAPFSFDSCKSQMQALFGKTSIAVTDEQLDKLTTLIEMLNTWNSALNLTAIKDVNQMVVLHILDSAVVSPVVNSVGEIKSVADVGTGAGFPGLVLAILNPNLNFTLIDSVGKKLSFVRQVVTKLKLDNVELINKRCEEIDHEPFDVIVSRAFAPIERMVSLCLPLLKEQGRFVAMKANLEENEIKDIPGTVTIERIEELKVPTLEAKRQAVILKHA